MALQEINFIRPEEVFTPSTEKARVRYKGYNGTERDIELADNLEGDVSEVINDTFVPNADGNVAFTDSDNVSHELLTAQGLGKAQVIATTWSALKALRDGGNLVAGSLYRITDYVTTTAQENTQSAGHQFDVVVLALSANKLAEEGWAMINESNIYDVTDTSGNSYKCYFYPMDDEECNLVEVSSLKGLDGLIYTSWTIDEANKTITGVAALDFDEGVVGTKYNYFSNSNLSAWKVWYCLDNDTDRFAWASDKSKINIGGEWYDRKEAADELNYYAWVNELLSSDIVYTLSQTPKIDDSIYIKYNNQFIEDAPIEDVSLEGTGVIYRLIDEFNNDLPYDFKNIQFPIPLTSGVYDSNSETSEYVYTFSSTFEDGACSDLSLSIVVNNVKVGNNPDGDGDGLVFYLPDNKFYQNGEEVAGFRNLVFGNLSTYNVVFGFVSNCSFGNASECVIAADVDNYTNIGHFNGEITSDDSDKLYINGVEVAVVQGE